MSKLNSIIDWELYQELYVGNTLVDKNFIDGYIISGDQIIKKDDSSQDDDN